MKPEPKVFSKESPCNKADLWQCFVRREGFVKVDVPTAQSIIGINVPRVMERNGYLVVEKEAQADCYKLTAAGEAWLLRGIMAYVKNHPSTRNTIPFLPSVIVTPRRRARTRTT